MMQLVLKDRKVFRDVLPFLFNPLNSLNQCVELNLVGVSSCTRSEIEPVVVWAWMHGVPPQTFVCVYEGIKCTRTSCSWAAVELSVNMFILIISGTVFFPLTLTLHLCLPLQGLRNKPKKTGHVKPDLIDVDLVRGEEKVCVRMRATFLSIRLIWLDTRQTVC